MSGDSDLYVNLGTERIFIGPTDVKVKTTRKIREVMTQIKAKHSPYNKVPRLPNETGEAWTERYLEYIGQTNVMREDEDLEAYKARVLSPSSLEDDLEYTKDILRGLAGLFGQDSKVTDENFDEAVLEDVCNFIVKLLKKAKYPTAEFELNR